MRRWVLALSLLLATRVAAEIRFGAERVIAAPKIGYRGEVSFPNDTRVTAGDGQFLVTWLEFRPDYLAGTSVFGRESKALAMRVDLTGHPLDPHPIQLPYWPVSVLWTGNEWLLVSTHVMRMDRSGNLAGPPVRLFDNDTTLRANTPAVWTGSALIVGVSDYFRNRLTTRSFDAQFNLLEETVHVADEDQGGFIAGFATDGVTAMMVFRRTELSLSPTYGAVFTRDGFLARTVQLPPDQIVYNAVSAAPGRYAVMGWASGTPGHRGVIVDSNGVLRADVPALGTDTTVAAGTLLWDGSQFRYLYRESPSWGVLLLRETEISLDGQPGATSAVDVPVSGVLKFANIGRTTALAYALPYSESSLLQVRVAPDAPSLATAALTPAAPNAEPRETPAAARSSSQVLVAWRQRVSVPGQLDVHAARLDLDGNPLDATSLHLGANTCAGVSPVVASDGRDFLVVWRNSAYIQGRIVRGDGTAAQGVNVGRLGVCTDGNVSVASNGSQYLVTWSEPHRTTKRVTVYASRVSADGVLLDDFPMALGETSLLDVKSTRVYAGSNGTDYLVTWESEGVRVTADGDVLDDKKSIPLGEGAAEAVWFNGTTYVVAMGLSSQYSFLRIGSDGSGGQTWNAPRPAVHTLPPLNPKTAMNPACDAGGCFVWWGGSILRIADDGQNFAATVQPAAVERIAGSGLLIQGSRLLAIYARGIFEAPYAGVADIRVRATGGGKTRAVRH